MAMGVKGTGPWSAHGDPATRLEMKRASAREAYRRKRDREKAAEAAEGLPPARRQTAPAVQRELPLSAIGSISVQTVETHTAPFTTRRQSVGQMVDDYLDGLRDAGKRVMSIAIELPADHWREG